jgi:hypothetical protein
VEKGGEKLPPMKLTRKQRAEVRKDITIAYLKAEEEARYAIKCCLRLGGVPQLATMELKRLQREAKQRHIET